MRLEDVLCLLSGLAPEDSALSDDPVGLLIGAASGSDISRIGVCLDATPSIAARAAIDGVQLLITHHPLIYHPLTRLDPINDPISRSAALLIKADIALYAMHTNWDRAAGGINDTLAAALDLIDVTPLASSGPGGLPRLGTLAVPRPLADFAHMVFTALSCSGPSALRCSGEDARTIISRVAVCGGAGAFLLSDVMAAGAQAYVTSDVRHHEFVDAAARGFPLLDAGHGATETPGMRALVHLLTCQLPHDVIVEFYE